MKRLTFFFYLIFLFATLSFISPGAFAQETHSYGMKFGSTLSTLSNQANYNLKPGLQLGGFAKLGGRESLFFKAELLASQAGTWNWNQERPNNINLYYLDLPLMFGINSFRGLSINLGIQASVLLAGTYRSSIGGNINNRSIGSNLARFDYSYLVGLEYFIKDDWFLGARFNYGFVPIQSYQGELTINNQYKLLSNRILQIYVGYVFR